ncbi:hypothetical protein BHE74_00038236 [Ensete ventricosum]|nr:hypothetical protein BHE74_00038236 [Ensete ventricosum]
MAVGEGRECVHNEAGSAGGALQEDGGVHGEDHRCGGEGEELTVEERHVLSVAYKNIIGAHRASWWIISSIEQKEEGSGNHNHVAALAATALRSSPPSAFSDRLLVPALSLSPPPSTLRSSTIDEG